MNIPHNINPPRPVKETWCQLQEPVANPMSLETREFRLAPQPTSFRCDSGFTDAIWTFAENLGSEEYVWLKVSKHGDAHQTLAIAFGAALSHSGADVKTCGVDTRFESLRQSLMLVYSGFEVIPCAESLQNKLGYSENVPLAGAPVIVSDLSGAIDPDLIADGPREPTAARHIVLGACTSRASLSEAICLLQSIDSPCGFRIVFRRTALFPNELRALSKLYRELADSRSSAILSGAEINRISDLSTLISAWLAAKAGVSLSVELFADQPVVRALKNELGKAFSMAPSARRDTLQPVLDLAGRFVRGQRRPNLAISDDILRTTRFAAGICSAPMQLRSGATLGSIGDRAPVQLDATSRSRHLIVCGATGTGKSTLIKNLIVSDIEQGYGVVLIDPHGDLHEEVLECVNRDPGLPVWNADTANLDQPYSLNLLQSKGDKYRQNFVCNQLIRLLKRSLYKDVPEGFGPMFEAYFRNAFLLLSDDGEGRFTISDMDRVFCDSRFRRELLETCSNEHVCRFWRSIATRAGGEAALENIVPYIVTKLTQIVGNPVISNIVCAKDSTLDFSEVFDAGGICLINLAKGKIGATEAEILGGILTTALFSTALDRSRHSREERRPVRIYLDEFQSYAGEVISELLAECRKYGLEMTLATQSLARLQIMNGDLTQSVLGNTGNIIALRSGPFDATLLSDWIGGDVKREDIMSLDDFRAIGRLLDKGKVSPPVNFLLNPPITPTTASLRRACHNGHEVGSNEIPF